MKAYTRIETLDNTIYVVVRAQSLKHAITKLEAVYPAAIDIYTDIVPMIKDHDTYIVKITGQDITGSIKTICNKTYESIKHVNLEKNTVYQAIDRTYDTVGDTSL